MSEIKVNTDPNCPGAGIRKGDNLHNWDITHRDRGHCAVSMSPERHREIFGPKATRKANRRGCKAD
jgi:hypothetical protein